VQVSHIFISYSHQDSDYARKLENALKRQGFEIWIDDRIDYGTRWPQVIQEQLDASAAVIVVMTSRSYGSEWVQNELARAKAKGKPVFPLLLEGDTWLAVQATQYVDVRDGRPPSKRFYDRLARVVLPRAAAPEAPAAPTPAVGKKTSVPALSQPFEPEMILIPAGEFLMGSNPRKDRDAHTSQQPQHRLYLPDYYIAKTPVTNAQYMAFVRASDHRQPSHWRNRNPPRGEGNRPVVNVTWHDAMAYCRWLAQVTDVPYSLPSEAEWEKGARGTDGRIYPWGNDWDATRCNTIEEGKKETTPVGAYPQGASPYGLLDMAGTVMEWTRSLWGRDADRPDFAYPYDPEDGREVLDVGDDVRRVVRGGSFFYSRLFARCACRGWVDPDQAFFDRGFRIVAHIAP
jgi:formylglycine-generating enzyme required for sulfatase activity